ncbi:hypothetical protein EJ06DRAFT_79676 [Trichodelitschia bisporula]|uniref:Uncharacterized protein n=1 Tax=Trichodelitschia bisporula TaxID=703511 RepID=A0A6G1HTE2_9PEZI|nr:hypothetical protein EJ06DRAFT_79676 [Trichodelitschia bisporula]
MDMSFFYKTGNMVLKNWQKRRAAIVSNHPSQPLGADELDLSEKITGLIFDREMRQTLLYEWLIEKGLWSSASQPIQLGDPSQWPPLISSPIFSDRPHSELDVLAGGMKDAILANIAARRASHCNGSDFWRRICASTCSLLGWRRKLRGLGARVGLRLCSVPGYRRRGAWWTGMSGCLSFY